MINIGRKCMVEKHMTRTSTIRRMPVTAIRKKMVIGISEYINNIFAILGGE